MTSTRFDFLPKTIFSLRLRGFFDIQLGRKPKHVAVMTLIIFYTYLYAINFVSDCQVIYIL